MNKTMEDQRISVDADLYRFITLIEGIELYLKTGMKLTRFATPTLLRNVATQYTGKTYKKSRQGLELALHDLRALQQSFKEDNP